jgi:hypothetical protein
VLSPAGWENAGLIYLHKETADPKKVVIVMCGLTV